jgi:hypothetical protein
MSLKSLLISLPILWRGATALPAGPGSWPNGTSYVYSSPDGVHASAAYNLIDTYDASNWVNKFDVQDIADPTRMCTDYTSILLKSNMHLDGFVDYVNGQQAQQLGLLKMQNGQVYMGVDSTTHLDPNGPGRKSVRVQSKTAYNRALVIADFAHVPGSACGSWPAL